MVNSSLSWNMNFGLAHLAAVLFLPNRNWDFLFLLETALPVGHGPAFQSSCGPHQ